MPDEVARLIDRLLRKGVSDNLREDLTEMKRQLADGASTRRTGAMCARWRSASACDAPTVASGLKFVATPLMQ